MIVEPGGIATLVQRIPTVWSLESWISSRSLLDSETLPLEDSSASSLDATVRFSMVVALAEGLTVMSWVTGVDGWLPVSVTISVTV